MNTHQNNLNQEESLPLKQVTLYKNELAYLERRGHASSAQLEVAASVKKLVLSTLSVKSDVPFAVLNKKTASENCNISDHEDDHDFHFTTSKNIGGFLSSLMGAQVSLILSKGETKGGICYVGGKKG
jgi:hypothetical protein